ncbi:MAG: PAS domain-containing protein [Polyangiaceae bacterium]
MNGERETPTPPRLRCDAEAEEAAPASVDELSLAVMALHAEIAVRKQAEDELWRKDRFLESIIENVPDMIFLKDAQELRFTRVNRAAEELLGLRREEMIGKNDHDFFPKDEADFFTAKDREVLASGRLRDIEAEPVHTRHRGVRWLHTKKIPIRDENGEPIYLLGISEDITERREAEEAKLRAEQELRQSAAELARSNLELEQFAYVASHDLQEPLRKIQAFADLLAKTCGPQLGAEGSDYVQRIQNAAGRMRALIQDLLALSRVTSKGRPFVTVDLATIARETLADLEVTISETAAEVTLGELPAVSADPMQMRQLFLNLIGNALKFRKEGEPPVVTVSGLRAGDRVELVFADRGIGFDDKYADRIWKPFQRLHVKERYPGTGIGLAICKKIVERHGGHVRVQSAPGQGATFHIDLWAAGAAPREAESEVQ